MKELKEKISRIVNKIKGIKNIKEIKNLNELARENQNKLAYLVIGGIGVFIFVGWFFMFSSPSQRDERDERNEINDSAEKVNKPDTKQEAQLVGTVDVQFNQESSKRALDEQQREIKGLNEKLTEISSQIELLQKSSDEKNLDEIGDGKVSIQELQTKINELEFALKKTGRHLSGGSDLGTGINESEARSFTRGITTTNFSYGNENRASSITGTIKDTVSSSSSNIIKPKTAKDYVPPGTFAKAVLLSGADTNAGVHGQTDTIPIVMRILDNGTLPNGARSSLKGCFVTAAAYGDASSERGQIRLQHLSCLRPGDHILDIPIEGTINDMGGNDGIRGHVVMRNHKLIWNAGVSGLLSGIGSAMQQSATSQAISPLGITSTIKSGKAFEYGAFSGANTALGKLADYYIKLADMYHPIVQVHAGSQVNIVFLKGFYLTEGISEQVSTEKDTKTETTSSNFQNGENPNLNQAIKNAQLGQAVSDQNNINGEAQ